MTSRIFLLRHAHAAWAMPGERDFDRRLDDRGLEEANRIALTMAVNGFVPDIVLCSKARRCVETWNAIAPRLKAHGAVVFSDELYASGHEAYVEMIARHAEHPTLLLIGHNPMMEDTAFFLVCKRDDGHEATLRGFPTGGLAVIDLPGSMTAAKACAGRLSAFLSPSDG